MSTAPATEVISCDGVAGDYFYRLEFRNGELAFDVGREAHNQGLSQVDREDMVRSTLRALETHVHHLCYELGMVPKHELDKTIERLTHIGGDHG